MVTTSARPGSVEDWTDLIRAYGFTPPAEPVELPSEPTLDPDPAPANEILASAGDGPRGFVPIASVPEADYVRDTAPVSVQTLCSAALLGAFAFSSFAFVDPYLTTDLHPLWVLRAVVVAGCLGIYGVLSRHGAKLVPYLVAVTALTCAWIGAGVVGVTVLVGGVATNYHEALLLTFFAFAGFPFPWRAWHGALTFSALVVLYDVACWTVGSPGTSAQWVTNNGILWIGALISGVILHHLGERGRAQHLDRQRYDQASRHLHGVVVPDDE